MITFEDASSLGRIAVGHFFALQMYVTLDSGDFELRKKKNGLIGLQAA